jgi:hypothetical protein
VKSAKVKSCLTHKGIFFYVLSKIIGKKDQHLSFLRFILCILLQLKSIVKMRYMAFYFTVMLDEANLFIPKASRNNPIGHWPMYSSNCYWKWLMYCVNTVLKQQHFILWIFAILFLAMYSTTLYFNIHIGLKPVIYGFDLTISISNNQLIKIIFIFLHKRKKGHTPNY